MPTSQVGEAGLGSSTPVCMSTSVGSVALMAMLLGCTTPCACNEDATESLAVDLQNALGESLTNFLN